LAPPERRRLPLTQPQALPDATARPQELVLDEVVAVVAGWLAELAPGQEASLADRE
jgi:hypothetical protein